MLHVHCSICLPSVLKSSKDHERVIVDNNQNDKNGKTCAFKTNINL